MVVDEVIQTIQPEGVEVAMTSKVDNLETIPYDGDIGHRVNHKKQKRPIMPLTDDHKDNSQTSKTKLPGETTLPVQAAPIISPDFILQNVELGLCDGQSVELKEKGVVVPLTIDLQNVGLCRNRKKSKKVSNITTGADVDDVRGGEPKTSIVEGTRNIVDHDDKR